MQQPSEPARPRPAVRRRVRAVAGLLSVIVVGSGAGCAATKASPGGDAVAGSGGAPGVTSSLPSREIWTTLTGSPLSVPQEPPPTPSSTTTPGTTGVVVDRCAGGGVPVVVDGQDAAMGLRWIILTAVNCTSAPVTLDGIPAIDLLAGDGQRFDITAQPGMAGEPDAVAATDPVTLAPGAAAGTTLSWRNLTEYDGPETAESVVLTLGDGLPPVTVELTVDMGTTHRAFISGWSPNDPAPPTG